MEYPKKYRGCKIFLWEIHHEGISCPWSNLLDSPQMKGTVGHLPVCCCKNCLLGLVSYNSSSAFLIIKLVSLFIQLGELEICLLSKISCESLLRNVSPVSDTVSSLTFWYNSYSAIFRCNYFPFWTPSLGENVAFRISLLSEMYVYSKDFKSSIAKKKAVSPCAGPVLDCIKHFKQLPLWVVKCAAWNKETWSSKLTEVTAEVV